MRSPTVFNLSEISTDSEMNSCLTTCLHSLSRDNVIAIPTDTIYGVACIPSSKIAINKIYAMKGRDWSKPVALCVSDFDSIYKWSKCHLTHDELSLFLPGKCTLIFERSSNLYNYLNPGVTSIGFRIPGDDFIVKLCSQLPEKSLVLTSANVSNSMSSLVPQEFEVLNEYIDIIVDKGIPLSSEQCRLGSTVIDLSTPECFKIVRQGSNSNFYKNILVNILKFKEI